MIQWGKRENFSEYEILFEKSCILLKAMAETKPREGIIFSLLSFCWIGLQSPYPDANIFLVKPQALITRMGSGTSGVTDRRVAGAERSDSPVPHAACRSVKHRKQAVQSYSRPRVWACPAPR